MANDVVDLQAELDKHRRAVDTDYFDLSIREIVRMVESDEIQVAPSYQRQFRWKEPVQSALIESLLLGLPIPAIFVATNKDGTWDVVDGLQRVCTILRFFAVDVPNSEALKFADNPLRLGEMSQLATFSKLAYEDLPVPIRLMLGKRYLRVQVLSDKSDHEVRFELFRRLNAGAVELTSQEVRSCVYRGPFNTLIEDLSVHPEYKALLKLGSKNLNDGTAEEIVLKFFAYLEGMEVFTGKVTAFLNAYMQKRGDETDLDSDRQLFLNTVRFLHSVTGGEFRRQGVHTTPLNQFEAVLVGIGRIFREGNQPKIPEPGWEQDEELVSASRVGTNSRPMLKKRVLRAQELFS
ncbi:DUF262 domain-containing protein [Streptomyces sp. NPDC088360]|uniref:DUF262 domain-containing protein n=1 Tax=Streptomyces sp. NPDC088360 TaxID=3154515 RepID=UPI003450AF32